MAEDSCVCLFMWALNAEATIMFEIDDHGDNYSFEMIVFVSFIGLIKPKICDACV